MKKVLKSIHIRLKHNNNNTRWDPNRFTGLTCIPTANKVYAGHLVVVLDGYINNILTFTQRYGEHKKFCKKRKFKFR